MAWIREQNKHSLIKVTRIYVAFSNLYAECVRQDPSDGASMIGGFKTKEAALAELDAIERWLDSGATGVYQVGSHPEAGV